jgi:hypothetical protein
MLEQDTAHALLTIADEQHARLAFVGDRHQLPAVGRGGVLDLAARWVDPQACLTLDTVHRFTRAITAPDGTVMRVADEQYARLSLAMRTGADPDEVFHTLHAREQIQVHASDGERLAAVADAAIAALEGRTPADPVAVVAVVADTREQVAALNAAIRERLVAAGRIQDQHVTITNAGQRIGVGDRVTTRRNDAGLGVANRDLWTVTRLGLDGTVLVADEHHTRSLPADYVRDHLELAYASTVHGVQGETSTLAHMCIGKQSSAASAYVGLTRGRQTNIAHLVADTLEDAREQWTAVFARDRADLGPDHARREAEREAARYAEPRPLEQVISELRAAWDAQAAAAATLAQLRPQLERAVEAEPRVAADQAASQAARAVATAAQQELDTARDRLAVSEQAIQASADQIAARVRGAWDEQRPAAQAAARRIQAGTGRFGRGRADIAAASERLEQWAQAWQPVLGDLHQRFGGLLGFAGQHALNDSVTAPIRDYAQTQAVQAHPEHAAYQVAVQHASDQAHAASMAHREIVREQDRRQHREDHLATPDNIERIRRHISIAEHALAAAEQQLAPLRREPAIRSRHDPDGWLTDQHAQWRTDRERQQEQREQKAAAALHTLADRHRSRYPASPSLAPDNSPGIGW